jgi:putative membrane protein insertion efficiency factor
MMARFFIGVVRAYRLLLSPWLGSSCRFEPTCSAYSLQALTRFGAAKGSYLTLARLGRCHPWCAGGLDPVPDVQNVHTTGLFSRLVSSSTQKKSS